MRKLLASAAVAFTAGGIVVATSASAHAAVGVDVFVGNTAVLVDVPVPAAALTCGTTTQLLTSDLADGRGDCTLLGDTAYVGWHVYSPEP